MIRGIILGMYQLKPRLTFLLALVFFAGHLEAQPVRMSIDAFEGEAQIEVRDLPSEQATQAIQKALYEIHAIDQLLHAQSEEAGSLGDLNRAAGKNSVTLDRRVATSLARAIQYCSWSNGAHGPLGGGLYDLWTNDGRLVPDPTDLREAVRNAECSRLNISGSLEEGGTVQAALAEGTRADLRGAARGFAVDAVVTILEEHGVTNAWIEIPPVYRALGPGPEDQGWYFALPKATDSGEPIDEIWLRDQALALVEKSPSDSVENASWIDQRTGVPSRGVAVVAAVAAFALDAEILAHTLFITGLRDGHLRLGSLEPRPSILWLLGESMDSSQALESSYRWSEVARVKRR